MFPPASIGSKSFRKVLHPFYNNFFPHGHKGDCAPEILLASMDLLAAQWGGHRRAMTLPKGDETSPGAREKSKSDWKRLASLWNRRKIEKTAHACRGQAIWEM
jgi:hypothetical protein